jgi:hypothetical protein
VLSVVERRKDGRWWAGRHVGSITLAGRTLVIQPRLGIDVVEAWLAVDGVPVEVAAALLQKERVSRVIGHVGIVARPTWRLDPRPEHAIVHAHMGQG